MLTCPILWTTLKVRISKPRDYLQALLRLAGRPHATLPSFRVTFNNTLGDLGLSIGDRQILMANASSETTKIYTHPNFELAAEFVNLLPARMSWTLERDQNVTSLP